MNVNSSELLDALPEDDPSGGVQTEGAQERLRELLTDLANRPVPANSLSRLWTLSELSAQIALARMAAWTRRWFAGAEESEPDSACHSMRGAWKPAARRPRSSTILPATNCYSESCVVWGSSFSFQH